MSTARRRATTLALAIGTALEVAMVIAGHFLPAVARSFAAGGTLLALVTGVLWALLADRPPAPTAAAWGALTGGLAGALGVVVSLLLGDVPASLLLLAGSSSAVAGAVGGLATAWWRLRSRGSAASAALVLTLLIGGQAAPLPGADTPPALDSSYRLPSGERVLRQEAVVAASRARVWEAFSTSEGLRSFVAPVAAIHLEIGGDWEASYDLHGGLGSPANIATTRSCSGVSSSASPPAVPSTGRRSRRAPRGAAVERQRPRPRGLNRPPETHRARCPRPPAAPSACRARWRREAAAGSGAVATAGALRPRLEDVTRGHHAVEAPAHHLAASCAHGALHLEAAALGARHGGGGVQPLPHAHRSQEAHLGGRQDHQRVVHCQHRRVVGEAEHESTVHQAPLVGRHGGAGE